MAVLRRASPVVGLFLLCVMAAPQAGAGGGRPSGRFSLFAGWTSRRYAGFGSDSSSELIATLSLHSGEPDVGEPSLDWAFDARVATFPGSDRDQRISLYEAWAGWRSRSGVWRLRVGQLWLDELGALGSVGGAHLEATLSRKRGWRAGVFGGLEPEIADAAYATDVTKGGGYVALDGAGGRRHVLGWVTIRHGGLAERSTIVLNNFVPVDRKLFVYQAMEYDTAGPGGLGGSRLSYFFTNVRYAVTRALEFQGTYHRGQSVDVRGITEDLLDGRPVDPRLVDGFLFESARFRVTVRPFRRLTAWAIAGRDTNNRGEPARNRLGLGLSARDVLRSGVDFTMTSTSIDFGDSSYTGLYLSAGRSFGRRLYMTLDYTQSLSVYRRAASGGGFVEVRPQSSRTALSANLNLNRRLGLLLSIEYYSSPTVDELRALAGLTVRF